MSFMSDYEKELNKLRNRKTSGSGGQKRVNSVSKNSSSSNAFMESYYNELDKLGYSDLAPVSSRIEDRVTIAPISKKDEEEDNRKWYQKGHFEDGHDFGDVTKTILGIDEDSASLRDLTIGSAKRGFYNTIYGEESFKAMMGEANNRETYEKLLEGEEYQFAPGNDLASGISGAFELGGQMVRQFTNPRALAFTGSAVGAALIAGNAGPQALVPEEIISVPTVVTAALTASSAASSLEVEAGHAYNEMIGLGIKEDTAKKIALAVGIGNAGLEMFQVDELLDAYKATAKKETTQTVAKLIYKELADRGVDVLTETGQEVAQEGITILGAQTASYLDKGEYAYTADEVKGRLADTAKSSALSFGMMNVPATVKNTASIVSNQKQTPSLTQNEQAVVKKVYEDELEKAEQDGKLSSKEKTKIYNSVVERMQRGEISTDDIERVLGGESYTAYDSLLKESEEFNTLYNTESGKLSEAQRDRLAELKKINESDPYENALLTSKSKLSQDVMGIVKDSRLMESYNERGRRSQAFEADLTQYDAKQQSVIQKAIDSGILNNTRRTHEFVDIIAKISADKGVPFDFTNNEKLKESGFAIEGKTVNGFVTKDGISINIDSPKAWQSTVGHEITHVLEGTELYSELQKAIYAYAETKGDFAARRKALEALYAGIKDANIDAELVADLVGEYLFTDKDFITRLSTENRNVFQKIYDEVKYLYKVATAGSKEARQLEKVKKAFEDAYREGNKNTEAKAEDFAESDTKYSISVSDKDMIDFLENQEHITTYKAMQVIDGELYPPMAAKVKDENGRYQLTNPSKLGVWQQATEDPKNIKKIKNGVGYYTLNKGDGTSIDAAYNPYEHSSNLVLNDQFESAHRRDNLVVVECVIPVSEMSSGYKAQYAKDSTGVMDWKAGVVAGKIKDNKRQVYLSRYLKPVRILSDAEVAAKYKEILDGTGVSVPFNVVQPSLLTELEKAGVSIDYEGSPMYKAQQKRMAEKEAGKAQKESGKAQAETKYSMSEDFSDMIDSDGEVLTQAQAQYFGEHGLKTDEGYLLKLYRSADGGRTVWGGRGSGSSAQGIYLTDDVYVARAFASDGKKVGDVLEVYARAENPLVIDAQGNNYMDIPMPENAPAWLEDSGDWEGRLNADQLPIDAFANGHDAVVIKNVREGVGGGPATDVILRDSNQMKRTDNTKPTSDSDIRYSLSEDSTGRELSPAVAKRFGNSKVVDDNGNLKVVYHGTASGEFSIFDKSKGSVEGDFGSGFYFTDNDADVSEHYEGGGPDFDNKVARLAEQIEADEDIDYEEAKQRAREELYVGSHKFEVYLNIENPAIVGETILFDSDFGDRYNEEDFDDYDDYIAETEQAVADSIETIVWEVEKNVDVYSTEGLAEVLFEAYYDGGIGIEELKKKINNLYLEDSNGNFVSNEVARQVIESLGYDGIIDPTVSGKWNMNIEDGTTHYIVFKPNQIKAVTNQNPTDNPDIHRSLSKLGEAPTKYGNYSTPASELRLEEIAPTVSASETVTEESSDVTPGAVSAAEMQEMFPDDGDNPQMELDGLNAEIEALETRIYAMSEAEDFGDEFNRLSEEWAESRAKALELEAEIAESEDGRVSSLEDSDAPPEMDAPYVGESDPVTVDNPFENRDWYKVGNRKVKAYMYENPEVKPFFQEEASVLLGELGDTIKGERIYNDQVHYDSGGEKGWMGVKRLTSKSMETLLDEWGMSYADIEKGLKAIIEDNGAENIAAAKKIEFMLNDRLLHGYRDFYSNGRIPPNQDYINLLNEKQISAYSQEAFDSFMQTADNYAPDDIAPVKPLAKATPDTMDAPIFESKDKNAIKGQTTMFEPEKQKVNPRVARVLTEETATAKEKSGIGMKLVSQLVDKGMVFENLSLERGNHELQAKWNYALPSNTEARAQYFMENGDVDTKSLKDIISEVEGTGKTERFFNYLYHVHNVDRMTLEDRFGVENKAVFGDTVTADVSRWKARQYERLNPEFKAMAEDIYAYNRHLRRMLVDGNVISQETADLWEKMYPHYVPIRRVDEAGQNISVPLDTNKTGVNNPVKRATGGSSDIQPLFETMAMRTEQTYRAIARNAFGIELKNTLGTTIDTQQNNANVDEMIDTIEAQEDHLLKPGTMYSKPTFTVFENGEKVEFEITEDMFDALKPAGKILGYRNKAINTVGNWRRNLLTSWNPVFALYRNPVKDLQDVAINSQHAVKTYLNVPNAIYQIATNGKWASEYEMNGGKSNTYFDSRTNKFRAEDNAFKKAIGLPIRAIETAGEFIEEIPRLAEYIASRNSGRSVERSMLDAARVTTNFAAGGDFTKFFNSHGFTFLNASVQGASQHVRNFREAKQQGLKGYVKVLAKYTIAGLPGIILNNLLWDDDEEYEELSDYVKQNYYVVFKTEDGKFFRIPKGRTSAVMQNLMEQMGHLVTGDDETDFGTFFELFMNNIAPNNPIENNILAPIAQAWNNEAWYGGDLVPSRLQSLPAEEQFDESTDTISRWLGEKTGLSPYKINYLLDQYSGGLGDVFLPMLTPEAESGDNTFMGNMLAPWKKEMTTDSVLNNKNPGDFYDLKDELEILSNSKNATEEDKMRSLYMDTVSWEIGDLYAQKREIQSSDLPADRKYEEVRQIQEQINELAKNATNGYNDVNIRGNYATVGNKRFNKDAESGKWYEIKPKNADGSDNYYYQKEQEVTKGLGISYEEYWNNRDEYNFAYDKPAQYSVAKAVGGYSAYKGYTSALYDIKADKDENGKSINGTRKKKVIEYINGLDADYGSRIILFKAEYPADDTYNYEIVDYLNGRDDISYEEMETILKYLGFNVDAKGNITW